MRRRIHAFVALTLLALALVPAINLFKAPTLEGKTWRKRGFLYSMDALAPWLARPLYELGISLDPKQVIVGRDGWLYLGDHYERTRSAHRLLPSAGDRAQVQEIAEATRTWDTHLHAQGVQMLRIMVAPNKESVWPDALPQWAAAASPNATDALMAAVDPRLYIDLRPALRARQASTDEPYFYRTDTHWNMLGAGEGFRAFAQRVAVAAPELRWPDEASYQLVRVDPRAGGDLARFLRLTEQLKDREPITTVLLAPAHVEHLELASQKLLHQGGNVQVLAPQQPMLVRNPGALNAKRVLWLRDSFGTALSPLMAHTFSEVLQLHWDAALAPGNAFDELVRTWRPDYVFITVVERAARSQAFTVRPPTALR